jgi:hypothetical protein
MSKKPEKQSGKPKSQEGKPATNGIAQTLKHHRSERTTQVVPPTQQTPLRLEYRDATELADNPANWRKHPAKQIDALRDVIEEVGWAGAALLNEKTGHLIDGHLRKKIGKGKIPVLIGSWSQEQERKILATLDPLAAMAEADKDRLESLLKSIQTESEPVKKLFEQLAQENRIDSLLPKPEDPGPQIDRAAELQKKWGVKSGDLFLIPSKTVPPRKVVRCPHCDCENEAQ